MNAVFTGPAFDKSGKSIVREDLIAACRNKGIVVQAGVKPSTTILVASRADTVKAKGAVARGLVVLSYPEFVAYHLQDEPIEKCAKPNPYTDKIAKILVDSDGPPDFTAEYGLSPEHIL